MRRLLFVTALLFTAPALADTTPAKPKPAKGSPDEVVCRRETVTGSLASSTRTCHTRAEWQAQAESAQAAAERDEEHGRINSEAPR